MYKCYAVSLQVKYLNNVECTFVLRITLISLLCISATLFILMNRNMACRKRLCLLLKKCI